MSNIINDDDWELLLSRIQEGKCTPFLGAGANNQILPTGGAFARDWADRFKYPLRNREDLAHVAQYVAIVKDEMWPKEQMQKAIKKTLGSVDLRQELLKEDNPIAALAELPLPVYITTNYDDLMYRALKATGKDPCLELCRWNEVLQRKRKSNFSHRSNFDPTPERPVVFHLHGHVELAESFVLTEDDYLDFLISISKQQELLPARIQEALTLSSLLFVGYRMSDLNFRVLFRSLVTGMEDALRRISLAIQLPHEDGHEAQAYLDRYFGKLNIKVFWGDAAEFMTELRQRWRVFNS